ncbi:MAG: lytic transglycosylase domain-containing protein, partial [Desulfuromonadaceae bacterium]|nr:lytic transglycosylase domain-containing protein [Desulfuromonadaceae bacterium]
MSIPIENLSLLGALAPLRQKTDSSASQKNNGFAEKLDKALGSSESSSFTVADKAREAAESLTLQMLQNTLALSGDSTSDSQTNSHPLSFSSANAFLHAYRDNLAEGGDAAPTSSAPVSSQLRELADGASAAVQAMAQDSPLHTETAWLDPVISRASRKYGVDAGLIRAVIKAESNFNPQAVSPAGARGLMQLMPATARSLGVVDSFDPEQNVMGGTRFLKDMLQRYGGNVDAALAAYNWGPGNVDKRSDHLPRETRDYLARVKQLYATYSV